MFLLGGLLFSLKPQTKFPKRDLLLVESFELHIAARTKKRKRGEYNSLKSCMHENKRDTQVGKTGRGELLSREGHPHQLSLIYFLVLRGRQAKISSPDRPVGVECARR